MQLLKKKGQGANSGAAPIGFTKQRKFLFFKIKAKPIYQQQNAPKGAATPTTATGEHITRFQLYVAKILEKQKDLEISLREQNIKESGFEFVKKMIVNSIIVSAILTVTLFVLLLHFGLNIVYDIIFAAVLFYAFYTTFLTRFVRYPIDRSKSIGSEVEKDILFAARDLVISMRSGMPLFNAMVAVSSGYGAASKEFEKIIDRVQLGMPIEQAIDEVSSKSNSKTFKRLMLQASVSIKAGADIVGALQGVVDEVMQERVIELRRYGQRLNALAMFYMLFGIIFPSMGIAVVAILTTFISLFTVNFTTLIFGLVGIFFLQLIFLNIMRSSRPTFAM